MNHRRAAVGDRTDGKIRPTPPVPPASAARRSAAAGVTASGGNCPDVAPAPPSTDGPTVTATTRVFARPGRAIPRGTAVRLSVANVFSSWRNTGGGVHVPVIVGMGELGFESRGDSPGFGSGSASEHQSGHHGAGRCVRREAGHRPRCEPPHGTPRARATLDGERRTHTHITGTSRGVTENLIAAIAFCKLKNRIRKFKQRERAEESSEADVSYEGQEGWSSPTARSWR